MKLLKNVYQVAGPSLSHPFDATAYLVADEKGFYMIDCGTPEGFERIQENIRSLGLNPGDIHTILVTHGHYDHVGAGYLWKEKYGCNISIHPLDKKQVETGDPEMTSAALLYGKVPVPVRIDAALEEGMTFPVKDGSLQVLHTPGHSMGSVSFVLRTQESVTLFAGDAVWGGFSEKIGSSEAQWRTTLDKLTSQHFDYYTFGHVGPQLLADADRRLLDAKLQFANYYNPWFKRFDIHYQF